jgi:DNA-binding winged helix-turn-helix (wHTH) protein
MGRTRNQAAAAFSAELAHPSTLFERDALEHMCDRLARIDGRLERLEDVLPANHDHRIDAAREQRGNTITLQAVALVLQAVDLNQMGAELGVRPQASQRLRNLLARAHEHLGEFDRLLHRRLNAIEPQLRGHLLGVVDDVIERRRERVAIAGVEGRAYAATPGQPVNDVVGDAIAFLLAHLQVLSQRGALGIVPQQIVQQKAAALQVTPGLFDQIHQNAVDAPAQEAHAARILTCARTRAAGIIAFTDFSPIDHEFATPLPSRHATLRVVAAYPESTDIPADVVYAGELEIRLDEGLVLATGRALTLSVREFELLVAMARRLGAIITREELYMTVWGGSLRPGDRSVDVYVSKLRGKLEDALPDRRFIHTHPGFGYRFQPQPSRDVHMEATGG